MVCTRVRVEGRVQGVGFRAWVEREARALSLAGFVRNRRDGSVEALFCGASEDVAAMIARCRAGPPASGVTAVRTEEDSAASAAPPAGFQVLATV
jgi:acylphosphatase